MKTKFLNSILALMFIISAIFIADYVLVAVVGIIANAFGASALFYQNVYPYVIALIISASIAYPLTAILLKRKNKVVDKINILFSHKHHIGDYKKTA